MIKTARSKLSILNRTITRSFRSKPDFIIAGAQKAGTSSLYKYLIQHPQILPASRKEVHYFDLFYSRSKNWYKSHFPLYKNLKGQRITGEATPNYMFHPRALKRISKFKPDIKIIIILRDPVERAISQYYQQKRKEREPLGILDAIRAEDKRLEPELSLLEKNPEYVSLIYQRYSYKKRGEYVGQLKNAYKLFPKENILLLESNNFFNKPKKTTSRVFNFLGVDDEFELNNIKKFNSGSYSYDNIKPETIEYLKNHFRSHNEDLFKYINRRFSWLGND